MDSHFGDQFGGASSIYIFVGTFPNIDVVNISGRIAVRFGALSMGSKFPVWPKWDQNWCKSLPAERSRLASNFGASLGRNPISIN